MQRERYTGLNIRAIAALSYKHFKQPNKLSTSKHSIGFTYSDFPCHIKVTRDKPALINHLWNRKKGERLTISANSFTKIDQLDGFRPDEKIPPAPGTNQIAVFVELKIKIIVFYVLKWLSFE